MIASTLELLVVALTSVVALAALGKASFEGVHGQRLQDVPASLRKVLISLSG